MDIRLVAKATTPFIHADGVGVQIYAGQSEIPVGIYHRDGISGTEHWRAAIAAILHKIEIHSDTVRYEFNGNVVLVAISGESISVAKFRTAIMASSRFIFWEAEGERTASAA